MKEESDKRRRTRFSVIKIVEIGYDDRDRKCDGKYTSNCTKRTDNFTPDTNWSHITVSNDGRQMKIVDGHLQNGA